MPRSGTTDYSASLLDLLLGSLGVIALFVFLFGAIRRNAEKKVPAVDQFVITIELSDERWAVGRDIGFSLEDAASGQVVEYRPGELVGENDLAIWGAPFRQHRGSTRSCYNARIMTQAEEDLKARLWVRRISPDMLSHQDDIVSALKNLKAWCYLYEDRDKDSAFLEPTATPQFDSTALFCVEFSIPVKSAAD